MDFKTYFFGLPVAEREAFAAKAHSSRGFLNQVAYRNKAIELGFADAICALSGGQVGLDDLLLTENAQRQRAIREAAEPVRPAQSAGCLGHGPCQQQRTVVEGTLCLTTALPMSRQPDGSLRCEMCAEAQAQEQAHQPEAKAA